MKLRKCTLFIILSLLVFSLQACGNRTREMYDESSTSAMEVDEVMVMESRDMSYDVNTSMRTSLVPLVKQGNQVVDFFTSKAADGTYDGDKKFIRTANLRFQVADVVLAAHTIEDIIIAKKGFIINSTLTNEEIYTTERRVSKDSIQFVTQNRLNGSLNLRVHHSYLDDVLREIAPLVEHIESRTVNADEVTFRILANKFEQDRKRDKSARIKNVTASSKSHKLEDLLAAEESIDVARGQTDAAIIAEKEMYDRVEYSTITISLWQDPTLHSKMKLRVVERAQYQQGFFANVGDAIASGWNGVLDTIEVLFVIWPLLLMIGGVVFAINYFRKKKAKQV